MPVLHNPWHPQQDAASDLIIKTLHVCPTRGCGIIYEGNTQKCKDCKEASVRKEIEAEYDKLHA